MTIDTAIAVAAIVLVLLWPLHQELTIRALRHSLRRQRDQLAQHRRAIIQLQGAATQPPTSVGQPMSVVRARDPRPAMAIPAPRHAGQEGANGGWKQAACDTDATLRLARPPALSDIEGVLTQAGRDLTATELARALERKPWDLIAPIDELITAGKIQTVPGHTAGRTAYRLADTDTLRMPHGMPLLPGTVAR